MLFRDVLQLSYLALVRQKMRTVLTVIALSIGISAVIIIVSAGRGLESLVLGELDMYNANTLNIEVRVPSKGGSGSATSMAQGVNITSLKNSDMEEIVKHPNISIAYNYVTNQQMIKYREESKSSIVFGYGANAALIDNIKMSEGRFYDVEEENSLAQVIVLGFKLKDELFKLKDELFGTDDAIGKNVFVKGKSFKVVGVQAKRGASFGIDFDKIVYIPTKTLQKKFLGTDYAMGINAQVIDMSQLESTKEDVEIILREKHDITDPDKDDFKVTTMDEIRGTLETVVGGITLLLIVLSVVLLCF